MVYTVRSSMKLVVLLCLCVVYGSPRGAELDKRDGNQKVDVAAIEKSLKTDGPAQTLKTYFNCSHPDGYRLIQSGDARAIDLAAKLLEVADGCDSEMLLSSLATAIQKNPEAVLPYMKTVQRGNVNRENFCIPFIAEETPRADALAVLERSERSLRAVNKPDLQKPKQICLDEIEKYRRSMDRGQESGKNSAH